MHRSSQWSLTFRPPNQNPVNTSPLPHACHMSSPPHPPWFNHPNDIRWRIQLWSSSLCNFLHDPSPSLLGPNIPLNTLFSKPSVYVPPPKWETKFPTHTAQLAKLQFCAFSCLIFWYDTGRQKILDWIIASSPWIYSTLDCITNQVSFRSSDLVKSFFVFSWHILNWGCLHSETSIWRRYVPIKPPTVAARQSMNAVAKNAWSFTSYIHVLMARCISRGETFIFYLIQIVCPRILLNTPPTSNRIFLEKLTVTQVVKKSHAFRK
jgi:hypothetical protein